MFPSIRNIFLTGGLSSLASSSPLPGSSPPTNMTARQSSIWRVDFWSGIACTGLNVASYNGPGNEPPIDTQNCRAIPEIGYSKAVTYYGDLDYLFRLHTTEGCTDITDFYIGNQDSPLCIRLDDTPGAVAWSVQVQA